MGRDATPPPEYHKIDQDLSEGAKGVFHYLCFTKEKKAGPPIKRIKVIHDTNPIWPEDAGWVRINNDLNRWSGGKYIYIFGTVILKI